MEHIVKYGIVAYHILGTALVIGHVGEEKKPTTPLTAALAFLINIGILGAIIKYWN